MANRSTLLNTPSLEGDTSALEGDWLVVAAAAWRVPLPWLCMFGPTDLRPCTMTSRTSVDRTSDVEMKFEFLNPAASVESAKARLHAARGWLEALAGDLAFGRACWSAAMAGLESLPHAFLTIDASEILMMDHLRTMTADYALAFGGTAPSLALRKKLSGYRDGFVAVPKGVGVSEGSADNAAALNAEFSGSQYHGKVSRSPERTRIWKDKLALMPVAPEEPRHPVVDEPPHVEVVESQTVEGKPSSEPCFVAGTLVHTQTGLRPIEEIVVGDMVLSYPATQKPPRRVRRDDERAFRRVTATSAHAVEGFREVSYASGNVRPPVRVTANHLVYSKRGWVAAGTLRLADMMTGMRFGHVMVTYNVVVDRQVMVHSLEVEEYHTYFVDEQGIWVHDKSRTGAQPSP